jgi:hypothetical protein
MLILEVAAGIVLAFFVIVYFDKITAAVSSAVETFVYGAGTLAVIAIIALMLPDLLRFAETPEGAFTIIASIGVLIVLLAFVYWRPDRAFRQPRK